MRARSSQKRIAFNAYSFYNYIAALSVLSQEYLQLELQRILSILFDSMDPSPFARNSFWGMSIGMALTWLSGLGISQVSMQRFLAVPTIKEAQK